MSGIAYKVSAQGAVQICAAVQAADQRSFPMAEGGTGASAVRRAELSLADKIDQPKAIQKGKIKKLYISL